MANDFENLVRPFQNNQVTPAQTYYTAGQAVALPVVLKLGLSGGSGKVLTGNYSYSQTFYCDGSETEKAIAEFRKQTGAGSGGGGGGG